MYTGGFKNDVPSITRDSIPFFKPEVEAIFDLFDPDEVYGSEVRDKLLSMLDQE